MAKDKIEIKREEKPFFKVDISQEIPTLPDFNNKEETDVRYPLIAPYAYAHIYWDKILGEVIYKIEEPVLNEREIKILEILEEGVRELINLSFISVNKKNEVIIYLEKNVRVLLNEMSISLSPESLLKLMYYIYRDFVGLNEAEPLLNDYYIEDIECNGVDSPIYIVHRKYRNLKTNLIYNDIKKLTSFVEKLAQKCGKYISYANPLLDGALPDGSRINSTYTQEISSKGPTYCFVDGYLQLGNGEITKIDKLFEKCKYNFGFKLENNNEVVEINNMFCCGVNEDNLNQANSKLKTIIKLQPPDKLTKIKFSDGAEITTTLNHLFHVADSSLKLIKAENLKNGMFVPMPSKIEVEGCTQSINIYNLIKEFSYIYKTCIITNPQIKEIVNNNILNYKNTYGDYRGPMSKDYNVSNSYFYEIINRGNSISFEILDKMHKNINELDDIKMVVYGGGTKEKNKDIKIPREVDEDLAYLAGAIISDGHLSRANIDISCYEEGFMNAVHSRLIKKFGKAEIYYNGTRVYLCNLFAPFFFNKIFNIPYGRKSKIVGVPKIIFKSNNKVISSFIKGLFDGDGTCKSGLGYKTYSKRLAEELTYLLARLGIYSKLINKNKEYRLIIPSIYEKIYSDKIGFDNYFKRDCLNELLNKKYSDAKSYINTGRVPAKPVLDLIKEAGFSKNKIIKLCGVNYSRLVYYDSLSKPFVKKIIEIIESEKNKKIDLEYIKWLVNCNQEFIKIESVEVFDNLDKKPVYDIELEPCKFFIAGNKPMNIFDTIRKFTKEPWSPIQLMDKETVSPEILAYLWMMVEYEKNIMVIGGTGSGKTTFINVIAFFIPPQARIVSIEDSVLGDTKIITKKEEKISIIKIEDFVSDGKTEILTLDKNYKIKFVKPKSFIKHKTNKDIYEVTTSTGRRIRITKDHSIFTLGENGLKETKPTDLIKNKSFIAVPRSLPFDCRGIKQINLLNYLDKLKRHFIYGEPVKEIFKNYKYKDLNTNKSTYQWWKKHNIIPIKTFIRLNYKFKNNELNKLYLKTKNTTRLPVLFNISDEFLQFIGLWLGDGSYDNFNKNRVIISNNDEECINLVKKISKDLNLNISKMNDNCSLTINSSLFYDFMKYALNLDGYSNTKKIPEFILNLSNKQIKEFIKGYFSADGTVKKYEVCCCSQSRELLEVLQTLFLRLNIISRINSIRKDKCMELSISSYENVNKFKDIKFLQDRKNLKLQNICNKKATHATSDIIPLSIKDLYKINKFKQLKNGYLNNMWHIGRNYLNEINNMFLDKNGQILPKNINFIKNISNSDILWDKVAFVKKLDKKERFVYDFSVDNYEKFIGENIILHNTRELQLYHENWLPSVSRPGIGLANLSGEKQGEVSLFDLLRESFRQRPDYIIVGEIRGAEAYVLFQGMASIDGNEKILVLNNHHLKKIKIKDLKNNIKYSALTIDPITGKSGIFPIRRKIIHPDRIELYKIKTRTGREITLTPNHSLFTYNNGIQPIFVNKLNIGDKIIIPAKLPCNYANEDFINLIEYLPKIRVFAPEYIKEAVRKLSYETCNKLCKIKSITDYYSNFKRSKPSAIKANKFLKLMKEAEIDYNLDKIKVRFDKKSKDNSLKLKISDEFLRLLGYYISEGSLNLNKSNIISLYSKNEKILEDMRKCIISVAGVNPRERETYGFGSSTELSFNHKIIFEFLKEYCGTRSKNKKIPEFIFGLSKERIGQFLSALYDGDGSLNKDCFGYYTISRELANDVTQLLLVYNVVAKIRSRKRRKNKDYEILFYRGYEKKNFLEFVKPLKLKKLDFKIDKLNEDYFIDRIKDIKKINLNKPKPVYDISVEGPQSFIGGFGGILLHNSGHPSMGTMHAEDVKTMIRRLETPPINLSPALVESMDVVCIMSQSRVKGKIVRKLSEVDEIVEVKEGVGNEKINTPFIWDPKTDKFFFKAKSKGFEKIMVHFGLDENQLYNELKLRTMLLMKMQQLRIFDFKEVQKIIHEYYKNPGEVLKRFKII